MSNNFYESSDYTLFCDHRQNIVNTMKKDFSPKDILYNSSIEKQENYTANLCKIIKEKNKNEDFLKVKKNKENDDIYVVSDIHGDVFSLIMSIIQSGFATLNENNPIKIVITPDGKEIAIPNLIVNPKFIKNNKKFIIDGDLIDRGPESIMCLALVDDLYNQSQEIINNEKNNSKNNKNPMIYLAGNHETSQFDYKTSDSVVDKYLLKMYQSGCFKCSYLTKDNILIQHAPITLERAERILKTICYVFSENKNFLNELNNSFKDNIYYKNLMTMLNNDFDFKKIKNNKNINYELILKYATSFMNDYYLKKLLDYKINHNDKPINDIYSYTCPNEYYVNNDPFLDPMKKNGIVGRSGRMASYMRGYLNVWDGTNPIYNPDESFLPGQMNGHIQFGEGNYEEINNVTKSHYIVCLDIGRSCGYGTSNVALFSYKANTNDFKKNIKNATMPIHHYDKYLTLKNTEDIIIRENQINDIIEDTKNNNTSLESNQINNIFESLNNNNDSLDLIKINIFKNTKNNKTNLESNQINIFKDDDSLDLNQINNNNYSLDSNQINIFKDTKNNKTNLESNQINNIFESPNNNNDSLDLNQINALIKDVKQIFEDGSFKKKENNFHTDETKQKNNKKKPSSFILTNNNKHIFEKTKIGKYETKCNFSKIYEYIKNTENNKNDKNNDHSNIDKKHLVEDDKIIKECDIEDDINNNVKKLKKRKKKVHKKNIILDDKIKTFINLYPTSKKQTPHMKAQEYSKLLEQRMKNKNNLNYLKRRKVQNIGNDFII